MSSTHILVIVIGALVSYLLGALPFGLWIGLWWKGVDVRTVGSKNIGATNVFRALGAGPALTVFALDALKGAAGIIGLLLLWPHFADGALPFPARIVLGLCAVVGHTFSPFLGFAGGKGIASSLGMLLALDWRVGLIGLGVWIVVVALTRYVSVASIVAAFSLPVSALLLLHGADRLWLLSLTALLAVYVTVKHKANMQRLRAGTEPKFGQRIAVEPAPAISGGEER